ncbi:MAG: hypothetical protein CM15mV10_1390 [uncultured marine virus]|nr:MAG: hypothetical protein CM15mV10_1390 [uncultured marine virus]
MSKQSQKNSVVLQLKLMYYRHRYSDDSFWLGSSDVDLTDTSESFGASATADLMFALISTEELEEQNQIMVKQLKNRYYDPTLNKRFCLGIDRSKMRLYDVDEAQKDLVDAGVEDKIIKKISGKNPSLN